MAFDRPFPRYSPRLARLTAVPGTIIAIASRDCRATGPGEARTRRHTTVVRHAAAAQSN